MPVFRLSWYCILYYTWGISLLFFCIWRHPMNCLWNCSNLISNKIIPHNQMPIPLKHDMAKSQIQAWPNWSIEHFILSITFLTNTKQNTKIGQANHNRAYGNRVITFRAPLHSISMHDYVMNLMLWLMTRTKQRHRISTEPRKRYPFVALEPSTFCLQGRRTTIIPEETSSLRFKAVKEHYRCNKLKSLSSRP